MEYAARMPRMPFPAILLGVLGLLPFLGCAAGTLLLPTEKADTYLAALIAYGAVVLSFLGAVHWGFVIGVSQPPAPGWRLTLGVLPALAAWVALLLTTAIGQGAGLLILLAAFAATLYVEARGARDGLVPRGYMLLRWIIGGAVLLILTAVTIVRFLGLHINF